MTAEKLSSEKNVSVTTEKNSVTMTNATVRPSAGLRANSVRMRSVWRGSGGIILDWVILILLTDGVQLAGVQAHEVVALLGAQPQQFAAPHAVSFDSMPSMG